MRANAQQMFYLLFSLCVSIFFVFAHRVCNTSVAMPTTLVQILRAVTLLPLVRIDLFENMIELIG